MVKNIFRLKNRLTIVFIALSILALAACDTGDEDSLNLSNVNSDLDPQNLPPLPSYVPSMSWALKADNLDFGTVNVGGKNQKYIELENISKETIKDLNIIKKIGSGFKISLPASCSDLAPGQKCNMSVKFSPKIGSQLFESLKFTFVIDGKKYKKDLSISAVAKDENSIEIINSSNVFGAKLAQMNEKSRITLTVAKKNAGNIEASDIDIKSNSLFTLVANQSTCRGAVLTANQRCTLVLKTIAPILAHTAINENIEINYKINKVQKTLNTTLDGSFNVVDLMIPATVDVGNVNLAVNTTQNLTIKISNPTGSSIKSAENFALTGLSTLPANITLDTGAASTCLVKKLAPGNDCNFILKLDATPVMVASNPNAFLNTLQVNYSVPGASLKVVPVQIKGSVNVITAGQYVSAKGQNFGIKNFKAGGSFDVEIDIENTSTAVSDIAKNFSFEMRDSVNQAVVKNWLPGFFVQIDKAKTTCDNAKTINACHMCKLVLTFTPSKTTSNNIDASFAVKYLNGANASQEYLFNVKGSWAQAAKAMLLSDALVAQVFPYYNKSYPRNSWWNFIDRIIGGKFYKVWRPNHGIIHGARKAAYALDTIDLLISANLLYMSAWMRDYTDPQSPRYNKDFIDQLVFAALMMRTGRSTEDNSYYKEDTALSAQYLKQEAPATGLFPRQQDIDDFVFGLETIGDTSKCYDNVGTQANPILQYTAARGCDTNRFYIFSFLYGVHHMDLRRMIGFDKDRLLESIANYFSLSGKNDPLVLRLWKRAGEYLKLTGDRDLEDPSSPAKIEDVKDIFYILSTNPIELRSKIEKLQHTPF